MHRRPFRDRARRDRNWRERESIIPASLCVGTFTVNAPKIAAASCRAKT
jgi:hypothetical protein